MARAADGGADTSSREPHAADHDQDSSSSLSSDTENSSDDLPSSGPRTSETRRLVSVIFGHIGSLYKVSLLLRRPEIHNKYIRSVSRNQSVSYFADWDKTHVSEKMNQRALDKGRRYEEPVGACTPLVSRLGAANTRRREQLMYWQRHPDRPTRIGAQSTVSTEQQAAAPEDLKGGFARYQPRQFESEPNIPAPSKGTKQSFSVVAKSVLDDNETFSGRPKTVYEPSACGGGRFSRVPDAPRPQPGSLTFDCPFCFSELGVKAMQQRQLWK
jgi:hypothetical protein